MLVVIVTGLLVPAAAFGQEANGTSRSWAGFQGGPAHTGTTGAGGPGSRTEELWAFRTLDHVESTNAYVGTGLAHDGERLYVSDALGTVYAIDAESGDMAWKAPLEMSARYRPVPSGGQLFVVGQWGEGIAYALDAATGEINWTWDPPEHDLEAAAGRPVVDDGQVVVATAGGVAVLDAETGEAVWRHEAAGEVSYNAVDADEVRSRPAVSSNHVFMPDPEAGAIVALDRSTGSVAWRQEVRHSPDASLSVRGGTLYVSAEAGLQARDLSGGELLWQSESRASDAPALTEDGSTLFAIHGGNLYAVDASTGDVRWQTEDRALAGGTPTIRGDRVYAASRQYSSASGQGVDQEVAVVLRAFDRETGQSVRTIRRINKDTHAGDSRAAGPGANAPVIAGDRAYVATAEGGVLAYRLDRVRAKWTFEAGGAVRSSPAVADGSVYVGSDDGRVYALDAASGEKRWATEVGDSVRSSPAVAEGRVHVGSSDGKLYTLDAGTGEVLWSRTVHDRFPAHASPTVHEGRVFIGAGQGLTLRAFEAESGDQAWSFEANKGSHPRLPSGEGTAAADDGVVYWGSGGRFYALDAGSGEVVWETPAGNIQGWSAPTVLEDVILVRRAELGIYVIDRETGERQGFHMRGRRQGPLDFGSPAVGEGRVFAFEGNGRLGSWPASGGSTMLANFGLPGKPHGSPAVGGGLLYATGAAGWDESPGGVIAAFGADRTGRSVWRYVTDGVVASSPALAGDVLFVGTDAGIVYALE